MAEKKKKNGKKEKVIEAEAEVLDPEKQEQEKPDPEKTESSATTLQEDIDNQESKELIVRLEETVPQIFNEAQRALVMNETPRYKIKKRKGKAGEMWSYVDVGYVIEQLNILTGFRWDFNKITEDTNPEYLKVSLQVIKQFIVSGTLVIKDKDGNSISKSDTGRKDVMEKKAGGWLDVGNDLKAAWSDCLKRCASKFGIALDVYSGAVKRRQDSEHPEAKITDAQRKRLELLASKSGMGHSGLKALIAKDYDYLSTKDIQRRHFDELVIKLEQAEVDKQQQEIPKKYALAFDELRVTKAKRLAVYRSYKAKKNLDGLMTFLNTKIDELNQKKEKAAANEQDKNKK